jgi:hypothetical protein
MPGGVVGRAEERHGGNGVGGDALDLGEIEAEVVEAFPADHVAPVIRAMWLCSW